MDELAESDKDEGACLCSLQRERLQDYPNLLKVAKTVGNYYPRLQTRTLRYGQKSEHLSLEISRTIADLPATSTRPPVTRANVTILDSGEGVFCVQGQMVGAVFKAFSGDDLFWDDIEVELEKLQSQYAFCAGIPRQEYDSTCRQVRFLPKYLREDGDCVRGKTCERWFKVRFNASKDEKSAVSEGMGRCTACSAGFRDARKLAKRAAVMSPGSVKKRASATSRYPVSLLSPPSMKNRYKSLRKLQRSEHIKVTRLKEKLEEELTVTLDDEQSKELSDFIQKAVPEDRCDQVLQDACADVVADDVDDQKEAMKAAFMEDIKRNREGHHGNRWNMATYRIALSVYARSPASYRTFQNWGIFALPSVSSLKQFTTALLQDEGPYYEYIEEQHRKYTALQEGIKAKGGLPPVGEGVLILDEVKVVGKVMWNSKNGKISGLAMDFEKYSSLQDLFSSDKKPAGSNRQAAEYILQFLWRDLSSSFDIIGPHYSSTTTMTARFTHACLYDAMHAFQVFGFKVVSIVLDGASTNLAMVKLVTGHGKGAYGLNGPDEDPHEVTPWFINPLFKQLKIYFIICPTHQLKNMINQLWASQPEQAKAFQYGRDGKTFGWAQIIGMWEREKARRDNMQVRMVKNLVKAYIDRDSWTKLNVKPAKIMQQEPVLAEIMSYANPDVGPPPDDQEEAMATYSYLKACSQLFEFGFLKSGFDGRIHDPNDSDILRSMDTGFQFFKSWMDQQRNEIDDFSSSSPKEKRFISWQTYDLLRVCVYGFHAFCQDYLSRHPGYYIVPLKVNGSAVETLFSQFKFSAGGKLTSVNYQFAKRSKQLQREVRPADVRTGEEGYRNVPLYTHDVPLRKKQKTK